ncbi:MAG TPA: DUF547 domain-containing protein [Xanthomonadales bacterium]|nr:DUF547 domain-containing protein [Xanthomonadales bacterium]
MFKRFNMYRISILMFLMVGVGNVSAQVPEPFQGHDPDSVFTISYSDFDAILRTMVVDVGRSTRKVARTTQPKTGTRMKAKTSSGRATSSEGNRFYFEEFEENDEFQEALRLVRDSIEGIPEQMALENFSRNEQLAYWLNLYNVTVLDELVQMYPEKNLKKELVGRKSILDQKLLNVAGIELSLNDIQYKILAGNYENNPLIMYGLYQGNIGGPNIRKRAYTGESVYRSLQDNAEEFVNSNRGTYTRNGDFEVSTLYERNSQYFPNFNDDLKQHLMRFIEGPERTELKQTDRLYADIDDWDITDLYGTDREIGGSFSNSAAAMMDAVVAIQPDGAGGTVTTNASVAGSAYMAKTEVAPKFDPSVLDQLLTIKAKEDATRLLKEGRVTVEEMGTVPVNTDDNTTEQDDE